VSNAFGFQAALVGVGETLLEGCLLESIAGYGAFDTRGLAVGGGGDGVDEIQLEDYYLLE
jgi:hypothetical protein